MTPAADLATILAALARSRAEETPTRRKAKVTVQPRLRPILPRSDSQGVSSDEVQRRLSRWGVDMSRERVKAALTYGKTTGAIIQGPSGLYAPIREQETAA